MTIERSCKQPRDGAGAIAASRAVALAVIFVSFVAAQQSPELTLSQAIDLALNNNDSLKSAKLDTVKAEKDLEANRTKRFAQIQLNALGSELITKPSVTFATGSLGNFPTTGPIPSTDQKISIARKPVGILYANVSQPLSKLYQTNLSLKASFKGLEATREDQRKQRLSTIDEVRRAYYDLVRAQSELDTAQASLRLYRESKRLSGEQLKREAILESQFLQSDVQFIKAQNLVSDDLDQLSSSAEKLNDLMGRDIHTQFRVADAIDVDGDTETQAVIEARAVLNRPDIRKAKLQVQQAEYDTRAKRAEYIPEISASFIFLSTGNFGNVLPTNITSAGLQLSWEPWDWGRKSHELAGKKAQEERAKLAVNSTLRSALIEVRQAWRQVQSSRRQVRETQASQNAARQKLREVQEQVKQEQVLTKELFSAQSDLASADNQYRQALSAFWSARADLKKSTGEE